MISFLQFFSNYHNFFFSRDRKKWSDLTTSWVNNVSGRAERAVRSALLGLGPRPTGTATATVAYNRAQIRVRKHVIPVVFTQIRTSVITYACLVYLDTKIVSTLLSLINTPCAEA